MGVLIRDGGPGREMVVWEITESYAELAAAALPADLESAMRFSSEARRRGHLAARAALRIISPGARIGYDENGVPCVAAGDPAANEKELFVSFSHCKGAAAAIVSDRNCAIDIENTDRDFSRAASRFVSDHERIIMGCSDELSLAAVWCAKETLYKYGRIPGRDFLRDMEILTYDPTAGTMTARLKDVLGIRLRIRHTGDIMVCHTV